LKQPEKKKKKEKEKEKGRSHKRGEMTWRKENKRK